MLILNNIMKENTMANCLSGIGWDDYDYVDDAEDEDTDDDGVDGDDDDDGGSENERTWVKFG